MSAEAAIFIDRLTKDFALGWRGTRLRAVDNLSLRIEAGMIFGLLGPNGSGKSTTIKVVLDLLAATAGECRIFGVPSGRVEARRSVGYLPESPYFHRHLTGRELVSFHGGLGGLAGARLKARVDEVLGWAGLSGAADRCVGTYSKGMLQRIGLAQALVHEPRLVILDEPTAGMDLSGIREMAALMRKLKAEGRTVVIISHLMDQVGELCDRVAILDRGRLVLEGSPAELAGAGAWQRLTVDSLTPDELVELRGWLGRRGRSLHEVEVAPVRFDRIFPQSKRSVFLPEN